MPAKKDFIVVIPAYNEEEKIEQLVTMVKKYADVCVVNDCSTDSTAVILSKFDDIHVIHHEKNTHIPGAVIDGLKYALSENYKYAITMDAGLSHNPEELPNFMNESHYDLVIGKRTRKINTPLYRKVLSIAGNFIYNISLDFPKSIFKTTYYHDITSGYRRYSQTAMKLLVSKELRSKSFDFLFESTMLIYRAGLSIFEIPISYNFSKSSLNPKVVRDCIAMCIKTIVSL